MKKLFFLPVFVALWASCSGPVKTEDETSSLSFSEDSEGMISEASEEAGNGAQSDRTNPEPMDGAKLEAILREVVGDGILVHGNAIEFSVQDIRLTCLYDETHNRMRVISAVKDYAEVTDEEKDLMLQSNFHSALDARYAVSRDVVYAAFIHPLSSLTEDDFLSGILQVASLKVSFGDSYSSGILQFQGQDRGESA